MLEYLKDFEKANPDAFYFLPGENGKTILESLTYKEFGDKVGGSELGDAYHIILFKEDKEGNMSGLEMFDAVLIAPYEYISRMMPDGWLGLIAKKTTTSLSFVQNVFDRLNDIEETE
ncbi:hypothetical protein UFOVP250_117 [uncultured Caudovirales phage]|uniref:Uncharacterized protein n=1 Tax=uncultured Caudovirales phage TaxID=2100421 RepID=A0A6J5LK03_9CAUD|nr:hypothetical protein UFOVP250_117 [uncultured Caudovirales phage]